MDVIPTKKKRKNAKAIDAAATTATAATKADRDVDKESSGRAQNEAKVSGRKSKLYRNLHMYLNCQTTYYIFQIICKSNAILY